LEQKGSHRRSTTWWLSEDENKGKTLGTAQLQVEDIIQRKSSYSPFSFFLFLLLFLLFPILVLDIILALTRAISDL
jgi:hypothetical protein